MTQDDDTPEAQKIAAVFDREAAIQQLHQTKAEMREMVRRKRQAEQASARAAQASNQREFAVNSLLAIEDELFAMFDSGETPAEILAYLTKSMPSVPAADLRHALDALRKRKGRADLHVKASRALPTNVGARHELLASAKATPKTEGSAAVKPASRQPLAKQSSAPAAQTDSGARCRIHPTLPNVELPDWADWSDQMADESDADYIFRKALEMPPETQRKFIGEHNR